MRIKCLVWERIIIAQKTLPGLNLDLLIHARVQGTSYQATLPLYFLNHFKSLFRRLTLSLPESNLESVNVVVPSESVDETLCFFDMKFKIFP